MAQTIPTGIYFGFTKAEVLTELERYKTEVKSAATGLAGASQNGQSYTFGERDDMTLAEWSEELQAAMAFFGLAYDPAPPVTLIGFQGNNGAGYHGGGFR